MCGEICVPIWAARSMGGRDGSSLNPKEEGTPSGGRNTRGGVVIPAVSVAVAVAAAVAAAVAVATDARPRS